MFRKGEGSWEEMNDLFERQKLVPSAGGEVLHREDVSEAEMEVCKMLALDFALTRRVAILSHRCPRAYSNATNVYATRH